MPDRVRHVFLLFHLIARKSGTLMPVMMICDGEKSKGEMLPCGKQLRLSYAFIIIPLNCSAVRLVVIRRQPCASPEYGDLQRFADRLCEGAFCPASPRLLTLARPFLRRGK